MPFARCSLFEKVEHAEKESTDLKQQLLACRGELQEALERAREAEAGQAAAAAAALQAGTDHEGGGPGSQSSDDMLSLTKAELVERVQALQRELAAAQHERRCVGERLSAACVAAGGGARPAHPQMCVLLRVRLFGCCVCVPARIHVCVPACLPRSAAAPIQVPDGQARLYRTT